ncbi:hypothetical protein, partial [Bartonella capreoli]|uniref:hypothetical protein n=1 Tax=Bartonella capreoli TaxID=155192 RepID=UPI001ABD0014
RVRGGDLCRAAGSKRLCKVMSCGRVAVRGGGCLFPMWPCQGLLACFICQDDAVMADGGMSKKPPCQAKARRGDCWSSNAETLKGSTHIVLDVGYKTAYSSAF